MLGMIGCGVMGSAMVQRLLDQGQSVICHDAAPKACKKVADAGSGRSGVSEVNFPLWILNEQYNSGFTMGLMRKDVGLAVSLAERTSLDLPATRAIAAIW